MTSLSLLAGRTVANNLFDLFLISGDYRRVCYYGSWAVYRNPPNDLRAGSIDPHLCSHLVFSFATIEDNGTQLKADTAQDLFS